MRNQFYKEVLNDDYKALNMGKSLHCVEFYKRIRDLKEKMNK
jgi:hypothetical protein